MRTFHLTAACASTALLSQGVFAWPGMQTTFEDLSQRRSGSNSLDSDELLGDLITLPDKKLTRVGRDIKSILTSQNSNPQSNEAYPFHKAPAPLGSQACARDTCCVWQYISDTMVEAFRGSSGRCTNAARGAVRLGFHDAGTWSKFSGVKGGADGSIILSGVEIQRSENRGLQEIAALTGEWYNQYKQYNISMADLIQMGANVATVVCPLGPRVKSYVGRIDSSEPAPAGLLPNVNSPANQLIQLFEDKTIRPHGLTALIGAHTVSQQRFVDPSRAGDPQDSTPGVWDTLFYRQTLGPAPPRVFRFQSDVVLAQDPRIAPEFQAFAGPGGQGHWGFDYAREYIRLSLLGVYNINKLTECTKVLPPVTNGFRAPDQGLLERWLNSTQVIPTVQDALQKGDPLDRVSSLVRSLKARTRSFLRA